MRPWQWHGKLSKQANKDPQLVDRAASAPLILNCPLPGQN